MAVAVYATRDIAAGDIVVVERPLVLTVAHAARAHTCAMCLADSRAASGHDAWPMNCAGCGKHAYCGDACARAERTTATLLCRDAYAAWRTTKIKCTGMPRQGHIRMR